MDGEPQPSGAHTLDSLGRRRVDGLIIDSHVFTTAENLVHRYHTVHHGNEMVLVAPLSLAAALLERGIQPLWAEMEQLAGEDGAEVTMRRRDGRMHYYRFTRFRRLIAVEMKFEEL